jgi:hypothetical protein
MPHIRNDYARDQLHFGIRSNVGFASIITDIIKDKYKHIWSICDENALIEGEKSRQLFLKNFKKIFIIEFLIVDCLTFITVTKR